MINCDKCGKRINKFAPAKMSFNFVETSKTMALQEHKLELDICMDCQLDFLESIGISTLLCFPENRERREAMKK